MDLEQPYNRYFHLYHLHYLLFVETVETFCADFHFLDSLNNPLEIFFW